MSGGIPSESPIRTAALNEVYGNPQLTSSTSSTDLNAKAVGTHSLTQSSSDLSLTESTDSASSPRPLSQRSSRVITNDELNTKSADTLKQISKGKNPTSKKSFKAFMASKKTHLVGSLLLGVGVIAVSAVISGALISGAIAFAGATSGGGALPAALVVVLALGIGVVGTGVGALIIKDALDVYRGKPSMFDEDKSKVGQALTKAAPGAVVNQTVGADVVQAPPASVPTRPPFPTTPLPPTPQPLGPLRTEGSSSVPAPNILHNPLQDTDTQYQPQSADTPQKAPTKNEVETFNNRHSNNRETEVLVKKSNKENVNPNRPRKRRQENRTKRGDLNEGISQQISTPQQPQKPQASSRAENQPINRPGKSYGSSIKGASTPVKPYQFNTINQNDYATIPSIPGYEEIQDAQPQLHELNNLIDLAEQKTK